LALGLALRAAVSGARAAVLDRASRLTRGAGQEAATSPEPEPGWFAMFAPLARLARPKDPEEMALVRRSLAHAGLRGARAFETFLGVKAALGVGLGGAVLAISLLVQPFPYAYVVAVGLAAAGFYAPNVWLGGRARARQTKIAHSLPDALDILVACVEGGLSLDGALARITPEIRASAPELASELSLTLAEMRAGISRSEAFRGLSARTGVEELRSLAGVIVQSEMFGTSIARSLRLLARTMRIRRTHQAEERAAKASVKMAFPLVVCILPSLLVVLVGPAVTRIAGAFSRVVGR
jgi:tight adherence protein C